MTGRLWLRFDDESSACPGCGSPRIVLLDAFSTPRGTAGRRVAFLSGCRACGLLFTNPLPTQEHLERFYSGGGEWASGLADRIGRVRAVRASAHKRPKSRTASAPRRPRQLLFDDIAAHAPLNRPPPGARALDVGCGDGKFLDRLQDRGWETYGIEPSTDMAFARHHRLEALPEEAGFDFVVLHHVLEHVTDPADLLRRVASATRDGGTLFISVPRLDTLPQHRDFKYCINGRNHPICFSETCLRGLLARAGFAVTARLDSPALDAALSDGKPLRLRLIARRTTAPLSLPSEPLDSAIAPLRKYASGRPVGERLGGLLPVRMRAALMDWARER